MVLFNIVVDLFFDYVFNGWWKVVWIIFFIFVLFLMVFVYLIVCGSGMVEWSVLVYCEQQYVVDLYICSVVGFSLSDEIDKVFKLLLVGMIMFDEFVVIKVCVLS